MPALAIVDAGPLYAAADVGDLDHAAALDVLASIELQLVLPALVVAEATYFVGTRLGPAAEAAFLHGLRELEVEGPSPEDFSRMSQLVAECADLSLGGTDASVIALAERLGASTVVTLDRRHFAAVRPRHRDAFELLP